MPRLLDDIRHGGQLVAPRYIDPVKMPEYDVFMRQMCQMLKAEMPVLVIDNVADYYYEGTGQEFWDLSQHFPNMAPPFEMFWAEYRMPKKIHSDVQGDTDVAALMPRGRSGWLVVGATPDDVTTRGGEPPEGTKWILIATHFLDSGLQKKEMQAPDGITFMSIDAEGRLIGHPWHQSFALPAAQEIVRAHMSWLHPVLLAMCFLHCKNVTLTDHVVPPKLAKRNREKHGYTPTGFQTLVIEPLKAILRSEGRSGEVGHAKAMHICRGHFKDYRQGKGLFGKYHQLVWHDSVVRGTRGEAAPHREMKIKLPKVGNGAS